MIAFAPLTALLPGSAQGVLQWVVFWGLSWLAILVHELGHAVVGKLLGMTILRFHVVPLEIRLRPWSFHLTRQVLGQDLGGAVVFARAPDISRWGRVLLSLAGPLANFASCGLLIALAYRAPGYAPEIVASLIGISLTYAIVNLVPFDTSDGAMILEALGLGSAQAA
ncbi:M50 family metallopeptidase [Sphingomonas sp. UYEF23]|uniref:M50 family metallopeptidase n=1 Tax=Sphingomonas sp. UYEF23 TaxID=1756408 RepID=UPI0033972335